MTPRELAGALRRQLNPRRARWQRPAALVRALRLRRGETVAEIGCGPGYFTARLARAPHRSTHQRLPPHARRDGVPSPAGRLATPRRARDQCGLERDVGVWAAVPAACAPHPFPARRPPRRAAVGHRAHDLAAPVLPDPAPRALSAAGWSSPRAAPGASLSRSPMGRISGRSARRSGPSMARALGAPRSRGAGRMHDRATKPEGRDDAQPDPARHARRDDARADRAFRGIRGGFCYSAPYGDLSPGRSIHRVGPPPLGLSCPGDGMDGGRTDGPKSRRSSLRIA